MQLWTSLPLLISLVIFLIIPESPRWLLKRQEEEKFVKVVKKGAQMNKVITLDILCCKQSYSNSTKSLKFRSQFPASYLKLEAVKTKTLWKNLLILLHIPYMPIQRTRKSWACPHYSRPERWSSLHWLCGSIGS